VTDLLERDGNIINNNNNSTKDNSNTNSNGKTPQNTDDATETSTSKNTDDTPETSSTASASSETETTAKKGEDSTLDDHRELSTTETPQPKTSTSASNSKKSTSSSEDKNKDINKICHFYQQNIFNGCRTGRSGKDCAFDHPEPCWRFINHGPSIGKNPEMSKGCKLGGNCSRFHPKLCRNAVARGECPNKNCRYIHPRNTKRTQTASTSSTTASNGSNNGDVNNNRGDESSKTPSSSSNSTTTSPSSNTLPRVQNEPAPTLTPTQGQQHTTDPSFLGLQRDMNLLQNQMHQMIKMMQMQMAWPSMQGQTTGQWNPNLATLFMK
jgi:hypothetical protein